MFQDRIKMLREESGMLQKEVADKVGVTERVYSFYETGRFPKNEGIIKNLARCFDCTTDYLLGVSEFKNYKEVKKIFENTKIFDQIEDPQALESVKRAFNAFADIAKSAGQQTTAFTHCLDGVAAAIHGIFSSYNLSVTKTDDYVKLLEFKAASTEKIDSMQESVKAVANELANKIKVNLKNDEVGEST